MHQLHVQQAVDPNAKHHKLCKHGKKAKGVFFWPFFMFGDISYCSFVNATQQLDTPFPKVLTFLRYCPFVSGKELRLEAGKGINLCLDKYHLDGVMIQTVDNLWEYSVYCFTVYNPYKQSN